MASLTETVSLALTLVLAIPAALAGIELALVRGEPFVGAVLLVLAVALVVARQYVPLSKKEAAVRAGSSLLPWGGDDSERKR